MILIIKHIFIEGPGVITDFFRDTRWQTEVVELERGDKLPYDPKDVEAIISLGGPMNVYEEEKFPFLKVEDRFLKEAIKLEIPILGICLGSQLLAKAAGARVGKAREKEIGWYKVNFTEEGMKDPLFEGLGRGLEVFQWHEDQFDVPPEGVLLAESKTCPNQAFKLGKNAYGLQFHIEVTPDMIESWIKEYLDNGEQVEAINARKIVEYAYDKKDQFRRQAKKFLLNFSRVIAEK